MRILLIEPPFERFIGSRFEWFPLGLAYIAAFLGKNGFECRIYSAEHDPNIGYLNHFTTYVENYDNYLSALKEKEHYVWKEIAKVIEAFSPDFVGISAKSVQIPSALEVAQICKEIDPGTWVALGGSHPTTNVEEVLTNENVDFVIRGEGEITTLELVRCLEEGANSEVSLKKIDGLSFKDCQGILRHNPPRPLIPQLDLLPHPARQLLMNLESYPPDQLNSVMTSRGCPFRCTFCAAHNIWARKVRYRSIDNIIEEIKLLRFRYGIRNITFIDDSFTLDRKRTMEFCQRLLDEGIKITWSCLTRVNSLDEEVIKFMRKAGCTKVDIGVESGSERVLSFIKKEITLNQVRYTMKLLRRYGIFTSVFFMLGLPGETIEDIKETQAFMKEIDPDWVCCGIFTPYPGTEAFDWCFQKGLIPTQIEWERFSHQSLHTHFVESISIEEFERLVRETFELFDNHNKRICSLFRRAKSRNYYRNPSLFIGDLKKFITWVGRR